MKFKFKITGKCRVTQLDHDIVSHQGSTAWDIASAETNTKLSYSVNVPVTCKAVDKNYCFTWWQTDEKVELANGEEDYLTLMFGHDESINAYVGMKIGANVQLGNMGSGGNSTGPHVHCEFGKGTYKGKWYANSEGVYVLYNAISFTDTTYMDDLDLQEPIHSNVIPRWEETKAKFKYTSEEPVVKPITTVPNVLNGEKWELDKFFEKLDEILNSKTRYLLGGIGRYDGDTRLFDCVGLFKSILWNYPAEPNNYNVTYPDVNVGGMKDRCSQVQKFDKSKMQKGMLVFIGTEHIGMVYDDRIIECTPAFNNCVQLTTPEMRADKPWTEMGYADFLKYPSSEPTEPPKEPSDIDTLLNELQSSIATLQAENKELSEKNTELEKELSDVKAELDTANSKLDEIRKVVS